MHQLDPVNLESVEDYRDLLQRIHDGRIRRVPQGELCLLQVPATHSNLPDPEAKVFPPKPSKFEVCQSYLVKTQ